MNDRPGGAAGRYTTRATHPGPPACNVLGSQGCGEGSGTRFGMGQGIIHDRQLNAGRRLFTRSRSQSSACSRYRVCHRRTVLRQICSLAAISVFVLPSFSAPMTRRRALERALAAAEAQLAARRREAEEAAGRLQEAEEATRRLRSRLARIESPIKSE